MGIARCIHCLFEALLGVSYFGLPRVSLRGELQLPFFLVFKLFGTVFFLLLPAAAREVTGEIRASGVDVCGSMCINPPQKNQQANQRRARLAILLS